MASRTLLQFFHWYYPDGGRLWREVADEAPRLAGLGITDVWLPPAYKGASGAASVGYDTYDLFDLGEFDQKGSVATKYGDRAGLAKAAHALDDCGIGTMLDVVFNHKMGADQKEQVSRAAGRRERSHPDIGGNIRGARLYAFYLRGTRRHPLAVHLGPEVFQRRGCNRTA